MLTSKLENLHLAITLGWHPLRYAQRDCMDVIDGEWIKKRLSTKHGEKSRLARHMQVKPEVVTRILNGERQVQAIEIPRVLSYFAESASRHMADENEAPFAPLGPSEDLEREPFALIAVFDADASAVPGLLAPEHDAVAYRLEFPTSYLAHLTDSHPRYLQVIGVKGISMLPTLKPGDLVMIDRNKTSLTYDGLFVLDIDDAILVKRIGRGSRQGFVNVISDNQDQPSFERAVRDIRVVGKVVCTMVKQ